MTIFYHLLHIRFNHFVLNYRSHIQVEYDVDEDDTQWLGLINEKRQKQNLPAVPIDTLELLMDRLEKESYFLVIIPCLIMTDFVHAYFFVLIYNL